MPKAKKKRAAKVLPPFTAADLEKFKTRARNGILASKADYDNAVALYVQELKKQKYAERAIKGDAKHWWKNNMEDLCPWRTALRDYAILKTFTVPTPEMNFDDFGATELDLAITYANDKGIPIPADPRLLTIDFIDDQGTPCSKPFPQCSYSELLLAVHGVARRLKHPPKLDPADQAWIEIAWKTLHYVDNPKKQFIGVREGDIAYWSLLRIPEGQLPWALNDLAKALNDFYASGTNS
jgi:hypothetical protein